MTKSDQFTYSEVLDKAFEKEELYLGFTEALDLMSFSEAKQTMSDMKYLHKQYYSTMNSMEGYNFSEADYSFAGFMDFLKGAAGKVGEGVQRHNQASADLINSITDPALAGKAQDWLGNLSTNIGSKLSQAQYENLLNSGTAGRDGVQEGEFGDKNLAKLVQFLGKGWDRDRSARQKAGLWDEQDEQKYQTGKEDEAARLESYRNPNPGASSNTDYFPEIPLDVESPAAAPAAAPAGDPIDDVEIFDTQKRKSRDSGKKPKQWKMPETDGFDSKMKAMMKNPPERPEGESFMENMDTMSGYTEVFAETSGEGSFKEFQSSFNEFKEKGGGNPRMYKAFMDKYMKARDPEEAKKFHKQAQEYKTVGGSDDTPKPKKNKQDYKGAFKSKAEKEADPDKKESYKRMSKEYTEVSDKMQAAYSEAVSKGDKKYAEDLLSDALKVTIKYEGLNYAESATDPLEVIAKAVQYSYRESVHADYPKTSTTKDNNTTPGYPKPPVGEPSKFAPGSNGVVMDHGEEEDCSKTEYMEAPGEAPMEAPAEESGMDQEAIMGLLSSLSDDEKLQLCDMIQSTMSPPEMAEGKEDCDMSEEERSYKGKVKGGDKSSKSTDAWDSAPDAKESYKSMEKNFWKDSDHSEEEDCDKEDKEDKKDKKDESYSEAIANEDEAKAAFLEKCNNSFSEFRFINKYYNQPLSFGENSQFDFSEWVDAFREANSASFNLYGNECGFNGNFPKDIVVTDADAKTDAAWAVYDKSGKFVTLSGISDFKDLSFSEPFKKSFCDSTKGSLVKSDRVARAALCSR